MKPKISIIIPTYNRVDSLAQSIYSVKNQTFDDWELIIIDDCSTDNTKQVIFSFMMNDKRIRYSCLEKNSGSPVIPRNKGVEIAQSDLITFLDSDDKWHSEKLETQFSFHNFTGANLSYHDMLVVYERRMNEKWSKIATCHSDYVFPFLLKKNFIPTSAVMMKKELYFVYNGMKEEFSINHDWDLWLRIAFDNKIEFINERLGFLYIHDGSIITEKLKRRIESRNIIRKWKNDIDRKTYTKIMGYYYFMQIFDYLPNWIQLGIRKLWYNQRRFK